jgi:hypothetical protein
VRYETLADLKGAYERGEVSDLDSVMAVDNDSCRVRAGGSVVFDMHPATVLEQALDLLEIPHEGV